MKFFLCRQPYVYNNIFIISIIIGIIFQIKKLSRWEVIDVVRTMSTEQAKQGLDVQGKKKIFYLLPLLLAFTGEGICLDLIYPFMQLIVHCVLIGCCCFVVLPILFITFMN